MYTNVNRIICAASDICFLYTKPLHLVIATAQLHSTKPEGSAQAQTLLAECWRFAMVRISDNGPGWK